MAFCGLGMTEGLTISMNIMYKCMELFYPAGLVWAISTDGDSITIITGSAGSYDSIEMESGELRIH